jgi:hypothetical protein
METRPGPDTIAEVAGTEFTEMILACRVDGTVTPAGKSITILSVPAVKYPLGDVTKSNLNCAAAPCAFGSTWMISELTDVPYTWYVGD